MAKLSTKGYLGFGRQAAFGTPVAPTAGLFMRYLSESLKNEQENLNGQEGGFGRYIVDSYKTKNSVKGELSCYARPDIIGFLLAMTLGTDTYAAGTPSVHTITPAVPELFTVERAIDDGTTLVERFQDCVVNDLTIDGESNQPI